MRSTLLVLLWIVSLGLVYSYTYSGGAFYCDSCSDCTAALNNNSANLVYLTTDKYDPGITCINNPENLTGKTFDCQGHFLRGDKTSGTSGFYATGKSDFNVYNCTFQNFNVGINFGETVTKATVKNTLLFNNSGEGFLAYGGGTINNIYIENTNSTFNGGEGFELYRVDYFLINNSRALNNSMSGFYIYGTTTDPTQHGNITQSVACGTTETDNHGFYFRYASDMYLFQNNTACFNRVDGFRFEDSKEIIVNDSAAYGNGKDGYHFEYVNVTQFNYSVAYSNGENGFYGSYLLNTTFGYDTAYTNDLNGFHFQNSGNATANLTVWIRKSNSSENTGNGFVLNSSEFIYLDDCNVFDNGEDGVLLSSGGLYLVNNSKIFGNMHGVHVRGPSTGNFMLYSEVYSNSYHGVYVEDGSNFQRIGWTSIHDNNWWGLFVSNANYQRVRNSVFYNNFGGGAYLDSLGDGGTLSDYINLTFYNNSMGGNHSLRLSSGSSDNVFFNITIYNETNYLWQETTAGSNNFTNLVMGYNATVGLVDWAFLSLTSANVNSSNFIAQPDFVSLNDTAVEEFNKSAANITINVSRCSPTPTVFRKTGFPTTRDEVLTGDVYPTSVSCASNIARFNVSSFSGYTADPLVNQCFYADTPGAVYTLVDNLVGNKSDGACITVNASNVFINCSGYNITGNYFGGPTYGIRVDDVENVTITGCIVSNYTHTDIFIDNSNNTNIINNTCYNNEYTAGHGLYGIRLYFSNNNNLVNNTVYMHYYEGIQLFGSYYNNITNNSAYNNSVGIYVDSNSNYNNIRDNYVHENSWGIHLHVSNYNNLTNNIAYNNTGTPDSSGIYIYPNSNNNTIFNNTVYSNTYGIYVSNSHENIIEANNASQNSNGIALSDASYNNLTNNIAYNNSEYGFYLVAGSHNNNLANNTAYNNSVVGFQTANSHNNTITSSYAYNNIWGIHLYASNYNNLTNNIVYNNTGTATASGIYIYPASNNNTVFNNTVYSNTYGIYVWWNSNDNIIESNNASQNSNGIALSNASYNNLTNNIAYNNSNFGIYLISSSNNRLTGDRAYNNSVDGFRISSSTDNVLVDVTSYSNSQRGFFVEAGSHGTVFNNASAYYNQLDGFFLVNSENLTITNSTSHNNNVGFQLSSTSGTQMFDIVAHGNTQGVSFGEGTLNITNAHLYDNSASDMYAASGAAGFDIYLFNITFDNQFGNFENYTSLNIVDSSSGSEVYAIKWNPEPASPPPGYPSFRQKYVDITVWGGSPSIDSIRFTWLDSELGGYEESMFELWFYNGTDWNYTSGQTLNTADNYIEVLNFQPSSVYGILQKNVSECMIISSPGTYSLTSNVAGAPYDASPLSGYACVKIAASDVLFDCNGYKITNNGTAGVTYGILLNGSLTNVTVRNCPGVSNYTYGIYIYQSNDSTFINNSAYNNSEDGFVLHLSSNNNLINNSAYNNSYDGFLLFSSSNNNLTNNSAYNNSYDGFQTANSDNNTITGSYAYNNIRGIHLYASNYNNLTNNKAHDNVAGFFIEYSNYTNFINNTAYSHPLNWDVMFSNSNNNNITGNNVSNSDSGIQLDNSNNNVLSFNIAYNNSGAFKISGGSTNNIISFNNASNARGVGFYCEAAPGNTFISNIAHDSAVRGFDFDSCGYSNITSNIAFNNVEGFYLSGSTYNNLTNNNAYLNQVGFNISTGTTDNRVLNNNASNNNFAGIMIYWTYGNIFADNIVSNNFNRGFYIYHGENNNITNNAISSNNFGIYMEYHSDYNNITRNNITNSNIRGIYAVDSDNNVIAANDILDTSGVSVAIWFSEGSDYNKIYDNLLVGGQNGISISATSTPVEYNAVRNNTIHDFTGDAGMILQHALYANISDNAVYNNTLGISVVSSDSTWITNNRIYNNTFDGLNIQSSSNNNVRNNVFHDNDNGLALSYTAGDIIVNNTAYGNEVGVSFDSTVPVIFQNNNITANANGLSLSFVNGFNTANPQYSGNEIYLNYYGTYIFRSSNIALTRVLHIHDNTLYEIYGEGDIDWLAIEETNTPEQEYVAFEDGTNIANLYLMRNYSISYGRVHFPIVNITTASADVPLNNTNFLLGDDFISLDDSVLQDFNTTADIWLRTTSCTGVKVYKAPGFPPDRATILATGTNITPTYLNCGGNVANFGVASFSGYALNVSAAAPPTPSKPSKKEKCIKVSIGMTGIECPENAVAFIVQEDGTPISGARIVIEGPWPWSDVKFTDKSGMTTFTLPRQGHYVLWVDGGSDDYCSEADYEFDYTMCGCFNDDDCKPTEYCELPGYATHLAMGRCLPVPCECGYVADHTCYPYDCCSDRDCAEGYRCDNHVCVPRIECEVDDDCAFDERCTDGKCVKIQPGECGYIANHAWFVYECCNDTDCPTGYVCKEHTCIPPLYRIETNSTGFIGDEHVARVFPEGSYTLTLIDPTGKRTQIQTDEHGYVRFRLESEGLYTLSLLRDEEMMASVNVSALKHVVPEEERPAWWEELAKNWCWLLGVLLLIIGIGYVLYRRKMEQFKFRKR
ncbi:MAG: right-handed parallel beta-helix repeat-containing protein [Candidatus Bilamarchaeaceae archaeon]